MGCGFGRRLFTHAVERASLQGLLSLTITADPHAEAFYLYLGAARVGSSRSEIDRQLRERSLLQFTLGPTRPTYPNK